VALRVRLTTGSPLSSGARTERHIVPDGRAMYLGRPPSRVGNNGTRITVCQGRLLGAAEVLYRAVEFQEL
jgi:hypothetical protein